MKSQTYFKQSGILNKIREEIVSGKWQPGAQVPTRFDLIEQFGVSSVTLQRALDRLAKEGFIETSPRQGTFVSTHPPHLYRYGVLFGTSYAALEAGPTNFWQVLSHQVELKRQDGVSFSIYRNIDIHGTSEDFNRLATDLKTHRLAGLIATEIYSIQTMLSTVQIPVVCFLEDADSRFESFYRLAGLPVDTDNFIQRAMQRLKTLGARRVAVITQGHMMLNFETMCLKKAQENGLTCKSGWVHGIGLNARQWLPNLMRLMFETGPEDRPDGLVIADDFLVEDTVGGALSAGIRVPQDLRIVALCNYPEVPRPMVPIEYLGYDVPKMVNKCVHLLREMRDGREINSVHPVSPVFQNEFTSTRVKTSEEPRKSLLPSD